MIQTRAQLYISEIVKKHQQEFYRKLFFEKYKQAETKADKDYYKRMLKHEGMEVT